MKHVFIINPISGTGAYKDVEVWIHNTFRNSKDSYEVIYTQYKGHATELAKNYKEETILYAVGGDGTANEVLNGMNWESQLALVPVGTGNDFWKMVDYENKDIVSLLDCLIHGDVKLVDVGSANDILFINSLNIGLDAEVNKDVNDVRKTMFPRSFIYIYYALKELMNKKPINLKVTIDDNEERNYKGLLATCMNGKWYGGGFKSAPNAKIDDGYLDFVLVEDVKRRQLPSLFPKYYKGEHLDLDVVNYAKIQKVIIETDHIVSVGFDGEIHEFSRLDVKVLPKRLSLRIPTGQ